MTSAIVVVGAIFGVICRIAYIVGILFFCATTLAFLRDDEKFKSLANDGFWTWVLVPAISLIAGLVWPLVLVGCFFAEYLFTPGLTFCGISFAKMTPSTDDDLEAGGNSTTTPGSGTAFSSPLIVQEDIGLKPFGTDGQSTVSAGDPPPYQAR
ncbi:hypothetical protein QBC39DRAFT_144383 [Podospora conica]|nr:hypothetical protein QBC39DRAFT_144383 [Schizothecium conicum]